MKTVPLRAKKFGRQGHDWRPAGELAKDASVTFVSISRAPVPAIPELPPEPTNAEILAAESDSDFALPEAVAVPKRSEFRIDPGLKSEGPG